jgi:hypothetical protein
MLATATGRDTADAWLKRARVEVFASSHSCLPVLANLTGGYVINNGAAGMPNFRDEIYGIATRVGVTPALVKDRLYGVRLGRLFVDAIALRYDAGGFLEDFNRQWPHDTPAAISYRDRIRQGPNYSLESALI